MSSLSPAPGSRSRFEAARNAVLVRFFAPIDITLLVFFRIAFGLVMVWEVYRYFDHGWIRRYYLDPAFNFTYVGFEWVKPWPGAGMYLHFFALGVLALFIALGLWYRVSATLFFVGFVYVFLLEKAQYLNHFYFVSLVSFLMIFVPANRAFALDVVHRPHLRLDRVPAWTLWLLRAQMGIVYIFGGLAKLNGDWLRGRPMDRWLPGRTDFPLIGRWFDESWMPYVFSYGGLLLDLLIVPLLFWRRTRLLALVWMVLFHVSNAQLFSIGIFPWLSIAATLLFLPPDLPRRAWAAFLNQSPTMRPETTRLAPVSGGAGLSTAYRATLALVAVYMAIQVVVPLRHHLYPGDVAWNEQGHRFSWRMMLRSKSGDVTFHVYHPASGTTTEVVAEEYITPRQAGDMATDPNMIVQFSHYLADVLGETGWGDVEIRAEAWVSLNGRDPQLLLDPTVNLLAADHGAIPTAWLMPLEPTRDVASLPLPLSF